MRNFVIRTVPWNKGREIHVFENDKEVGTTQSESALPGSIFGMAEEWIELQYGLTDDEFTVDWTGDYQYI